MIRKLLALLFPARPFPEPDGVLDDMLTDYIRRREHEVRTAENLEIIGDYIVASSEQQENPK